MKINAGRCGFTAIAAVCLVLGGCGKTARVTLDELNSMQKHTFWSDKQTVFSSTASVLQDMGYIVRSTDHASGLITAEGLMREVGKNWITRNKTTERVFVSAIVEEIPGTGSSIRLKLVKNRASEHWFSRDSVSEDIVQDPKSYQEIFDKIEQKVQSIQQIQLYQLQQGNRHN